MRVMVNGEQREIASRSVEALLGELEYEGTHFAIAVNYDVLPKSRWSQTQLQAGDEIEIITPRQGG
ncbi:MAG TPA: sulfur carrier protein ThiS [Bradyrhizobium sp.]|jgi:sulfur carrier protein|nr:sulfur carrier protein ThiS [Bradyrhizobium sp.]